MITFSKHAFAHSRYGGDDRLKLVRPERQEGAANLDEPERSDTNGHSDYQPGFRLNIDARPLPR